MRGSLTGLIVLAYVAVVSPAIAQPADPVGVICEHIAKAAGRYRLPLGFFTRLIWQESRFQVTALSPVGARGIAQFMPDTAAERGLVDPFSMPEAIDQSAAYLDELRGMFGNLGLAAAAYNAGPGRLSRWLKGDVELPRETMDYVPIITDHTVEEWRQAKIPDIDTPAMFSCPRIVTSTRVAALPDDSPSGPQLPRKDWAVILVGHPLRAKAMAEYREVRSKFAGILGGYEPSVVHKRIGGLSVARYIAQIEWDQRKDANDFCARLRHAGGNCIVLSNRL